MLDPVGSTSWHNRHQSYFERLNELLVADGAVDPLVLIVGPGAVTYLAAGLLNDAAVDASAVRKLIGDAARYSDQLLRRIPLMPMRTLEPVEVESALTLPHRLAIVDRSRRVLGAVRRQLPDADCRLVDLSSDAIPLTADVVIAFNIICRLEDPTTGMRHLTDALRPGGLLMIDDRSAKAHLPGSPMFTEVAPKTHRRASQ